MGNQTSPENEITTKEQRSPGMKLDKLPEPAQIAKFRAFWRAEGKQFRQAQGGTCNWLKGWWKGDSVSGLEHHDAMLTR